MRKRSLIFLFILLFSQSHIKLYAELADPVGYDILLIDSQGREVGYNPANGSIVEENPHGIYTDLPIEDDGDEYKWLCITTPPKGDYKLYIIGKDTCTYDISVSAYTENANRTDHILTGDISPGEIKSAILKYSPNDNEPTEIITDTSPPTIAIAIPDTNKYINAISSIPVNFLVSDSYDPSPICYAYLQNIQNGTTIQVLNGQLVDTGSIQEGRWVLVVEAKDWLGNSSRSTSAEFIVTSDTIAPQIDITSPQGGQYVAKISSIPISFFAADNRDSNPFVKAYLRNFENGTTVQVVNGQLFDPDTLQDGSWALVVSASDNSENYSELWSDGFEVIHDTMPPRTDFGLSGYQFNANGTVYISTETVFYRGQYFDDMKELADCWGSGVKETYAAIDSTGSFTVYVDSINIPQPGRHTFYYFSIDNAGNREAIKSYEVSVDTTPPAIVINSPNGGEFIAHVSSIPVNYVVNDDIPSPTSNAYLQNLDNGTTVQVLNGQFVDTGALQIGRWNLVVEARDLVGNNNRLTSTDFVIIADTIAPQIEIYSPQGGEYIARLSSAPISFSIADNYDSTPFVQAFLRKIEDGTTIQVSNGELFDPDTLQDGSWALVIMASDISGNYNELWSDGFNVVHDIMPPRTDFGFNGNWCNSNGTIYLSSETVFNRTQCFDDMKVAEDCWGTGVKDTYIAVDSTSVFVTYGGPVNIPTEDRHTFYFYSIDNVGNREEIKSYEVVVDTTAPESALQVDGPMFEANGRRYTCWASCTINAAETKELQSGINEEFQYKIDDGSWQSCGRQFTLPMVPEGEHTLYYRSSDLVGNWEPAKPYMFVYDTLASNTLIDTVNGHIVGNGEGEVCYVSSRSTITLTAIDPGEMPSGVEELDYSIIYSSGTGYNSSYQLVNSTFSNFLSSTFTISGPDGAYTLEYYSYDNLYNSWWDPNLINRVSYILDNTPPLVTIDSMTSMVNEPQQVISGTFYEQNIASITVNGIVAAIDYFNHTYSATITLSDGDNSISIKSYDLADNIGTSTLTITLDTVPPSLTIPADLTVEATGAYTTVNIGTATATDVLPTTITNDAPAAFGIGTTTVTWTAVDASSNTATGYQRIRVVDTTTPILSVAGGMSAAPALAGGGYNSFALKTNGTIESWGWCWGTPPVDSIAVAGGWHGMALKRDGTVAVWGDNSYGQQNIPAGLTNVVAIASNLMYLGAVKADGTVAIWGRCDYGQNNVPAGLSNVTAIALGHCDVMALKSDGTIVAWGLNGNGQDNIPAGLGSVKAIAAGWQYSVALKSDGTVAVWGWDVCGPTPAGLSGVTAIASGDTHVLALKSDGTVVAWGRNIEGQCNVPAGLTDVVAIGAGGRHSLAVKSDGTVVAWGWNDNGQRNVPAGLNAGLTGGLTVEATAAGTPLNLGTATATDIFPVTITNDAPVGGRLGKTFVKWTATDQNGNKATKYQLVNIVDTTPPVLTITAPRGGEIYRANISSIPVNFSFFDIIDTAPVVTAYLYNQVLSTQIAVSSGQRIDPLTISSGTWKLVVEARDFSGNNTSTSTASFEVVYDEIAPETSVVTGAPRVDAFGIQCISPATPISLVAVDPLSTGAASGVNRIEYRIDGGSFTVYVSSFTILDEGAQTIEYRAIDDVGNIEEVKNYPVTVASMFDNVLTGIDGIGITGNSTITGNVASKGALDISGDVQVVGTTTSYVVALSSVPIDLSTVTVQVPMTNDNVLIPLTQNGMIPLDTNGIFTVSGNDSITLSTGTYCFTAMHISSNAAVNLNGSVNILCMGSVSILGNSTLNAGGDTYGLTLFVASSSSTVSVSGGSTLCGLVYAPGSEVTISGASYACGSFFGQSIQVNSSSTVSLTITSSTTTFMASRPISILPKPAIATAFVKGDIYCYPNPARNGIHPTIHIEVGTADRVEITIFDIAGELVHQTELTGDPSLKNGKLSYEYVWNDSGIASGVYLCLIKAHKEGEGTIKTITKLAIIK